MTQTREQVVARLEAGETGRAIDADVFRVFGYTVKVLEGFGGDKFLAYPPDGPQRCEPARLAVATSLDAALALLERVRPGDGFSIETGSVCGAEAGLSQKAYWAVLWTDSGITRTRIGLSYSKATPAAALVAALLKAGV